MPGQVPPVADEREGLLAYLAQQRHVIRVAAHGLTDDHARAVPLTLVDEAGPPGVNKPQAEKDPLPQPQPQPRR